MTRDRCAGIRLIREFAPNGEMQVFNKFKVLAQNEELDFALAQVDLNGGTVPYLTLAIPDLDKIDEEKLPKATIVGHPWGASLRYNDAQVVFADTTSMELRSVATSGNSGSPILNSQMQVIGLYHSSTWVKNTVTKDGKVNHFGYGTPTISIVNLLAKVFPLIAKKQKTAEENKELNISLSSTDFKECAELICGEILPAALAATEIEGKPDRATLAAQAYATKNQHQAILKMARSFKEKADPEEYLKGLDTYLVRLSRDSGIPAFKNPEELEEYTGKIDLDKLNKKRPGLLGLLMKSGAIDLAECEKHLPPYKDFISKYLLHLAAYCHSSSSSEHPDPLVKFLDTYKPIKDWSDESLDRIVNAIEVQSSFRTFTKIERRKILEFLTEASQKVQNQRIAFEIEAVYTKLQRDQKLFQPESWIKTFPAESI